MSTNQGEGLPASAEVVVIGGGVMGLSVAHHLAAAGVTDVVVLERDRLGAGSTVRAAGGIRTAFSDEVNVRLAQRSLAAFDRFAEDHGQDIDLHRSGYLFLLADAEQEQEFAAASALQRSVGIDSRMIGIDEACRLSPLVDPDGLVGAMWSPNDGHCSPESVVLGFAGSARRGGVRIVTGCEATGLEVVGGAIRCVRTDRGEIATSTVICCAGAWSAQVGAWAGVDLPVRGLRRHVGLTSPVADLDPATPFTIDFSTSLYFHREGPGLLVGVPDDTDRWGLDSPQDPGWLEWLAGSLAHRVRGGDELGLRLAWAGLYEVTPDHNALIGRSAEVDGFLYATGFSGHGFLMGPAVGEVVRDLYLRQPPVVNVAELSADRFSAHAARPEKHVI